MGGASNLPPGFHFFPSDEELIVHFLRRKASLLPCRPDIVPTLPPNRYDPWELNGMHLILSFTYSCILITTQLVDVKSWYQQLFQGKALEAGNQWYFFSHSTQSRTSRNGQWNPIGADEAVSSGGRNIGLKKKFIFSIGEPFQSNKTNWVMHEYHLLDGNGGSSTSSSSGKRSHKKKGHSNKVSVAYILLHLATKKNELCI